MKKFVLFALLAAVVVAGNACKKAEEAAPAAETTAAETPAPASDSLASAYTPIGVPECDDYVRDYLECLDSKVPAESREQIRSAFEATRSGWASLAASETTKATLATACTQARESARASMSTFGCSF